jgi:hypothetical protein
MAKRNYWFDLFTGVTWQEFKAAGGKVSGFRDSGRNAGQNLLIIRDKALDESYSKSWRDHAGHSEGYMGR